MSSRERKTAISGNGQSRTGKSGDPATDRARADKTAEFEAASRARPPTKYVLRLYVAGSTPRSLRAIENLRRICEEHLHGRYDLEVIDVYQDPALARDEQLLALPTLVKKLPAPLQKFIGDLSDSERILVGLDIVSAAPEGKAKRPGEPGRSDGGER